MTVDDVGTLAKLQQEFECGTREIRKPVKVIGLVVDLLAVEEIIGMMRVNEVHPKSCTLTTTTFGTHVSCHQSRLTFSRAHTSQKGEGVYPPQLQSKRRSCA
jgi:hypothetical protein